MQAVTILLLRSDSSSEFATTLHGILAAPSCANLKQSLRVIERRGGLCDEDVAGLIRGQSPEVCLVVLNPCLMRQADTLLPRIKSESPATQVVIGLEGGEPSQMLRLFELGADDFITPPLRAIDILPRIWRLTTQAARPAGAAGPEHCGDGLKQIIVRNAEFRAEIDKIPSIARCGASVMILGETGTGKELCAHAVHYLSRRANRSFVPVNCGAIPTELVENELFGHERGAFTGAVSTEAGLIREAEGGTLFLDEIDCLTSQAQVKLLRFLQDREYKPLGSTKFYLADVRVISAMNGDCKAAIESGRLRRDLYYRLNVIPLKLPPLRERREDILPLARHFLAKYIKEFGKPGRELSPDAVQALIGYDWPGNVRELEHIIERAVVFSNLPLITAADIALADGEERLPRQSFKEAKARLIQRFEKDYIQELLLANRGNVSEAARAAHKNRRVFWQLIRKHRIDIECLRAGAK